MKSPSSTETDIRAITVFNEAGARTADDACGSPRWGLEMSDSLLPGIRLVMEAPGSLQALRGVIAAG